MNILIIIKIRTNYSQLDPFSIFNLFIFFEDLLNHPYDTQIVTVIVNIRYIFTFAKIEYFRHIGSFHLRMLFSGKFALKWNVYRIIDV